MSSPRILLTGANGFVGSHLRHALAARVPDAIIVGLCSVGHLRRPSDRAADLLDRSAVFDVVADVRPDVVIHLAAQSSVGYAQGSGSGLAWAVNVGGTLNLALAVARHAPEASVVFSSTADVYGNGLGPLNAVEETPLAPLNTYARSKVIAERLLSDVLSPRTRLVLARPVNHTGPGQRAPFVLPSFADQIARIEVGLQEPRLKVGNLDVVRDFLDVRDVAEAYVRLVQARASLPKRFVVNIASGQPHRLRSILDTLLRMSEVRVDIEVDRSRLRAADALATYATADLMRETTGWIPRFAIESTLAELLAAARVTARKDAESLRHGSRSARQSTNGRDALAS